MKPKVKRGNHLIPEHLLRLPSPASWSVAAYWGFGRTPAVDGLWELDGVSW